VANRWSRFLTTLLMAWLLWPAAGQNSVLSSGRWFKFSLSHDGIYSIGYDQLARAGASPSSLDPKTIKVFGYPSGMLPQANSTPRPLDLIEIPVMVTGEEGGKFGRDDRIIFYAGGPDQITFDAKSSAYSITNNLYSDRSYVFLTFGQGPGKRITAGQNLKGGPTIDTWFDFFYSEVDKKNILKSGRDWFGLDFDANTQAILEWEMSEPTPGSAVKIITRLMAESYQDASFNLKYNDKDLGSFPILSIPQTSYGLKGRTRNDTLITPVSGTGKHNVKLEYNRGGNNYSIGRLDYLLAMVNRKLSIGNNPLIFFDTDTKGGLHTLALTSTKNSIVWEITDPFNSKEITTDFDGGKLSFGTTTGIGAHFAVFRTDQKLLQPTFEGKVINQNLRQAGPADFIIVTHPLFESQARQLAAHRKSHDGLTTLVCTTEGVYNEYSGGRQDVSAIRDFVRDQFVKHGRLKYLLLFGKGTYDYRGLTAKNTSLVPIYESLNSLAPLETYASDDYFAFLENNEGSWRERPSEFHTLDIGVGRIPCVTSEEAQQYINKLIAYDTDPRHRGSWRKEVVFVADDGDGNIHQSQALQLASQLETSNPQIHAGRLFLDLFKQVTKPFGQLSPEGTVNLRRAFHDGAAIINYTGHGSEQQWTAERMLDAELISNLDNRNRLPFVVTATCEFGRTDDPATISASEKLLFKSTGGAIGLVSTSRPVSSATNFELNKDFYLSLFERQSGNLPTIGEVFRKTKNRRNTGVANRNFILLGDPSMKLALPDAQINITRSSIEQTQNTVGSGSTVTFEGDISLNNLKLTTYQGALTAELYAPKKTTKTKGDENPVLEFETWDEWIYRGTASIENGKFSISFNVSENIDRFADAGRLILYADGDEKFPDAGGSLTGIKFSSGNNTLADQTPPLAELFVNDSSFVEGTAVSTDPIIYAQLTDASGIDQSNHPEFGLKLTLDKDSVFFAGGYFVQDNQQKGSGSLRFRLFGLTEGTHTIRLDFADLAGNKSMKEITFLVGEGSLDIKSLQVYPNPVQQESRLVFSHNRPGEDLISRLLVTDNMGRQVREITANLEECPTVTTWAAWDGTDDQGNKLPPGVYYLLLEVRSARDGAKNQRAVRSILLN